MMPFEIGDIVLVRFPYTSQAAYKQRPAVVISRRSYNETRADVVILAITSQLHAPLRPGEAAVGEWRGAGLLKPSVLKPVIATIEQQMVLKRLGALYPADRAALREVIAFVLG
jgi:mRNA interferase MazF